MNSGEEMGNCLKKIKKRKPRRVDTVFISEALNVKVKEELKKIRRNSEYKKEQPSIT